MDIESSINLKNYEILNTITPKFYQKKFPYNILPRSMEPHVELTHKKIDLEYVQGKNYFVTPENKPRKTGGAANISLFFV